MTLVHHTQEQWDALEKEFFGLKRDNVHLKTENKRMSGKCLFLEGKIRRLMAEIEALRSEYELPAADPTVEEIKKLFPRLPFIQNMRRQVFLCLWKHHKSLEAGDPNAPPYLNAFDIHIRLYGHLKAPPSSRVISVMIHFLRKELQTTPLWIEGKHGVGWKLTVLQPGVARKKP
jgi:hypothetical protein